VPSLALLDTDTLSEVMKGQDLHTQQKAQHYLTTYGQFRFSIITRYEILRGLKAKDALRQIAIFEDQCRKSHVYPLTDGIIVQASDIYAFLHKHGLLISDADILIAATTLAHNLTLVTGNLDHFNRIPNLISESWKLP